MQSLLPKEEIEPEVSRDCQSLVAGAGLEQPGLGPVHGRPCQPWVAAASATPRPRCWAPSLPGHGQQAEVVAAAPDPTAPGSSSFPTPASYRDLGQDPSLALSPVGWVCTGCFWIFLSVNFESFSINYTPGISSILGPCHPILDSKALTLPWDSCCGTLLNSTATFPET